jgi:hypothetical protein
MNIENQFDRSPRRARHTPLSGIVEGYHEILRWPYCVMPYACAAKEISAPVSGIAQVRNGETSDRE